MDSNLEKKLAKGVRFILAPFVVEVISMIYIKKFSLFILIGLITFLTGCSANKSEIPQKEKNFIPISKVETDTITENYKNLDISNTKITIPDVHLKDSWKSLNIIFESMKDWKRILIWYLI